MGLWLLLFIGCYGMGTALLMSQGRMGGRLTGWPWSKEPIEAATSAEG